MNKRLTKSRILQLFSVLALAGIYSAAQAAVDNVNVQLQLNSDQTELNITTRGNCSANNHNGCIAVGAGEQARMNFSFVGGKQCNSSEDAKWEIGEIYLGGKNNEDKPGTWGGLDQDVEDDFSVADAVTGRLNKESGSNDQSIIIFDQNKHAYEIWYKVTAVCVDSEGSVLATVESDPRIKNGGTQ